MKKALLILLSCAGLLSAFDLTVGSVPEIVIPAGRHLSTKLAADELSLYVEKVSGKKLPVVIGNSSAQKQIIVGNSENLSELPKEIKNAFAKENVKADAFCILSKDQRLFLVGNKNVAELYAVYHFLHRQLGVYWLKPADDVDDGEYFEHKDTIVIKDGFEFNQPDFTYRRFDLTGAAWNIIPKKGIAWTLRNGMQASHAYGSRPKIKDLVEYYDTRVMDINVGQGGHTTFSSAVPKSLFETHPEYFSLLDGKRTLFDGGHSCYQYCISNPGVQELVLNKILKKIEEYGVDKYQYLFGMADTSVGWCECDTCKALDGNGENDGFNVSTRFHKVAESIAQKVYAKYPDARLSVWAYASYREIPHHVTHDPRMELIYCIHGRCYAHQLDDPNCRRNVNQLSLLKKWLAISPKVRSYEYYNCTHPFYVPTERTLAKDIALYKQIGLIGFKEEAPFPDAGFVPKRKDYEVRKDIFPSIWQHNYVLAKLLWRTEQDVNAILADIEPKYYGTAYPAMGKYHELRRKLWENSTGCMGYPTGDQRRPALLSVPGAQDNLLALLAQAEKLAGNDARLLHRIGLDKDYLTRYWIEPNVKLKAKFGNAMRAPKTTGPVIIDGDGSDAAWIAACSIDNFKTMDANKSPIPKELATSVCILSDDKYLYFLVNAKEPQIDKMKMSAGHDSPVWSNDAMEFFIYPPTAANSYYQMAVNPKGTIFDAINPGANSTFNLDAEVKTKINTDGYVIEARVRADTLGPFDRGGIWRLHIGRNRTIGNEKHFSIDGENYHDCTAYRALEIGSPYLRNGTFDTLKDGKPAHWDMIKATLNTGSGSNSVTINPNGRIYNCMTDPELWQSDKPRRISVTFKASSKGKVILCAYRYTDTTDGKAKHGYTRKNHPTERIKEWNLNNSSQILTAEYTIKPNEWAAIALHADKDEVTVSDVSVKLLSFTK